MELLEETPILVKPIILGILGNSKAATWTRDTIAESVMNPVISEIGLPTTILMPTEGSTSILLQVWSDRQNIPTQPIDADWIRLGRRARALRDGRILKESTHLIFFLGPKSDYYEKVAIREAKKGKKVFTVDGKTNEITELC
jgi:hypothetical protein